MDLASAAGGVFAAFRLSGAAGLNAWIPLLATAALARGGMLELAAPYDSLSSTPWLAVLSVALVLDFVGDKVPAVDLGAARARGGGPSRRRGDPLRRADGSQTPAGYRAMRLARSPGSSRSIA